MEGEVSHATTRRSFLKAAARACSPQPHRPVRSAP